MGFGWRKFSSFALSRRVENSRVSKMSTGQMHFGSSSSREEEFVEDRLKVSLPLKYIRMEPNLVMCYATLYQAKSNHQRNFPLDTAMPRHNKEALAVI
jgi:hypothetical protein